MTPREASSKIAALRIALKIIAGQRHKLLAHEELCDDVWCKYAINVLNGTKDL